MGRGGGREAAVKKQTHQQVVRTRRGQNRGAGPSLGDEGTASWEKQPLDNKKPARPSVWGEGDCMHESRGEKELGAITQWFPVVPSGWLVHSPLLEPLRHPPAPAVALWALPGPSSHHQGCPSRQDGARAKRTGVSGQVTWALVLWAFLQEPVSPPLQGHQPRLCS